MNSFYSHQHTTVLLLPRFPDGYPDGYGEATAASKYDDRGWCCFEKAVASMIKNKKLLIDLGKVDDVDAITEIVWEREMQRTTGIGEGLAVPHGRCPKLEKLVLAMGIPSQPIDFQSFDRKPVEFVVLVLSPADAITDHVQVLGAVSRLMGDRSFRQQAIDADSAESLSGLFLESLSKL